MSNELDRKDKILNYIEANPGCTKTKVYNCTDMAEGTAKNILKKLINDRTVTCKIDDVNPRIHHLYINDVETSLRKTDSFILSKIGEQMKNQMYTTVALENGELISIPVRTRFTTNYPSVSQIIDNLIKRPTK